MFPFAKMISLLVLIFAGLVFATPPQLANVIEPSVSNRGGIQEVHLGSDVEAAIARIQPNPNFQLFSITNFQSDVWRTYPEVDGHLPQAVRADLNDDGVQDIVLMGSTINNSVSMIGVLSTPQGYVASTINHWSAKDIRGWNNSHQVLTPLGIRNWPLSLDLAPDGQIQYFKHTLGINLNERLPHIKYLGDSNGTAEGVFRVEGNRFERINPSPRQIRRASKQNSGARTGRSGP